MDANSTSPNTLKISARYIRALLATAGLLASAANLPAFGAPNAGIQLQYQQKALADVASDLQHQSGIEFKVPADLSRDVINRSTGAHTWADAVKALLKGYNYLGYSGKNGKLNRVVITGRNGNGTDPAEGPVAHTSNTKTQSGLLGYRPGPVPTAFQAYQAGSVTRVTVPYDRLSKMKIGEKIPLQLPSGQYQAVHDNVFKHANGDRTWVGYLDQQGKEYRVVITYGSKGGMGQIVSPGGEYQIEQQNDANYLVDVGASGLSHGSLEDDQAMHEPEGVAPPPAGGANTDAAAEGKGKPSLADVRKAVGVPAELAEEEGGAAAAGDSGTPSPIIVNGVDVSSSVIPSVIDVMVAYTNGMDNANLDTRLNQLMALTNQAYIDSQIQMSLRLVGKTKVTYSDTNANTTALMDLTNGGNRGTGSLAAIRNLRSQLKADLVVLVRPYYKATQGNCGYTWINGASGTTLVASKGYATVSDGVDRTGQPWFCNDYTFAHEVGHSFGNVHERGTNAPTPGAYPFAYGWGVGGVAGTIMSYVRPLVPYFANPNIVCNGLSCGVPTTEPNSADNAATTNLTGNTVSKFFIAP